jgi:hypothetical protein
MHVPKKSSTAPLNNAEARARLSEARAYLEMAALRVASDSPAERKVSGGRLPFGHARRMALAT